MNDINEWRGIMDALWSDNNKWNDYETPSNKNDTFIMIDHDMFCLIDVDVIAFDNVVNI